MTTGSLDRSDLNQINFVVQNTQLSVVKDIVIGLVKDEFGKDSYYHYVRDEWGFPKTPDLTDVPYDAGFNDDATTRVFIGEKFRHDVQFYPQILVYTGSGRDEPISFNRNKETVKYGAQLFIDGYGNQTVVTTPEAFVFAGAWTGSINIDVHTLDIYSRDEIVKFLMIFFRDIRYEEFLRAGVAIKSVSSGAPSEGQDRQQRPLYKQTVTLDVRTEWRREIPVQSTVDIITFCCEFVRLDQEPRIASPNFTIQTLVELTDAMEEF